MRKLIVGSLVAVLGSVAVPAAARTNVDFHLNVGPPPVHYEYVAASRAGFVWVPGYWDWRYSRRHWVAGHWLRHRPGRYYEPARWHHRDDRHYYRAGGWRDSDHDGVPNRYDRAPYNPRWR